MTPFLQFRVWWSRATAAGRSGVVTAGVLILALLVWIAVPPGQAGSQSVNSAGTAAAPGSPGATTTGASSARVPSSGGSALPGATQPSSSGAVAPTALGSTGAGSTSSGASTGATVSEGPGAVPSSTAQPTSSTTAGPCSSPTKLQVGVVLDNVAGLNATFGVPSPSGQQAEYNAVFDAINKGGAAGCHTLVGDFQSYNEFDTSTAQATCLTFAQHKDFAVLNGYLPTGTDDCVMQHHIPLFEIQPIGAADVQHFYPYYFSAHAELQRVYRNFVYAAQKMNVWQTKSGPQKVGILYRDCQPDVNTSFIADLALVGIPANRISKFDVGCPADFASPTAIEQAILQFKAAGVAVMTIDNDLGDVQALTKDAELQGFHPRWVIPDNGIVGATGSVLFEPDPNNFNNALAISPDQYGAPNSGLPETATTKQCDQIQTSHGQPAVLASSSSFAGVVCDVAWMFAAALKNAPAPTNDQLAAGLQKAGTVAFSYPFGPPDFTAAGTTFGGQKWRPVTFHSSCNCWKVDSPTFQPPF